MTLCPVLRLNGFTHAELFHSAGLYHLDQVFLAQLKEKNTALHEKLLLYRTAPEQVSQLETSELLINCATILENFLANFFGIEEAVAISQVKTTTNNPISVFKKYFVLRRAKKELQRTKSFPHFLDLNEWLLTELKKTPLQSEDKELAIALLGSHYLADAEKFKHAIEKLVQWCAQALVSKEGQQIVKNWTSFRIPEKLDYANLVITMPLENDKYGRKTAPETKLRLRDGFKLTDPRMNAREVQDEINYCIYCHDHDGDFCSKGFPVKKGDAEQGFKKNPLDTTLPVVH